MKINFNMKREYFKPKHIIFINVKISSTTINKRFPFYMPKIFSPIRNQQIQKMSQT